MELDCQIINGRVKTKLCVGLTNSEGHTTSNSNITFEVSAMKIISLR
jgi:hypothetical protein